MQSLAASVLAVVAFVPILAGIVYWQPDGIVGVGAGVLILGAAVVVELAERRARQGGQ